MLRISLINPAETKVKAGIPTIFWLFLLMISSFDRGTTHTNEKWYFGLIHFIYKPRAGLTSLDSLVIKTKFLLLSLWMRYAARKSDYAMT